MDRQNQQSVEHFMSAICGDDFTERLAKVFSEGKVPLNAPELSVILENRSILGLSVEEHGLFGAAQRRYAMITSFARLIRACERLGSVLVDAGCIPSDEVLYQLRQDERRRRQETPN